MLFLAPVKLVGTGMSTGSGITSIMSADTLTAPSSFLSVWRVDQRWAGRGTGCSTGSWAGGGGGTYVHQGSTGSLEFPSDHPGIFVHAVVRSGGSDFITDPGG